MLRGLIFLWLLTGGVSFALPPESFENFALVKQGKVSGYFETEFLYQAPAWRNDFESASVMAGIPTKSGNLWTLGAKSMVAPAAGERSAFLGRYDLVFWHTHSLAVRYVHEEWAYIASAKEVWGLDYNLYTPWGKTSGFYFTFGYYYRWLKQRWNNDWGNPTNYNTQDQESFFHSVFGFQFPLGGNNFWTIDINWRDHFSYYNFDNMNIDIGLYYPGTHTLLKVHGGIRSTALTMGAGFAGEYYAGLGLQFY